MQPPASFAGIETRAGWRGKAPSSKGPWKSGAGCLRILAAKFRALSHRSPIIPLSTGPGLFRKTLTRRTLNPSQAAAERPSRKAEAQGGFPEARTARNESRFACWRDGCRRGRGKRANADGGPMLAMKAVKPSMARWAKPARVESGVVWNGRCLRVTTGRTVKIKAGLARRPYGSCCRNRVLI